MATQVRYEQALEALRKLEGHADKQVIRAVRVVAGYLESDPGEHGELLRIVSEGSRLKEASLEFRAIASRDDQVYPLKKPLKIKIQYEENYFFVESPGFRVHGMGGSVGEAVRNYMDQFLAHYRWLKRHKLELVPTLKQELAKIQRLLAPHL